MKARSITAVLGSLLVLALLSGTASASDEPYSFEMLIFEWPGQAGAEDSAAAEPKTDGRNVLGRLETLAATGKALGPVAHTLRQKGMNVLEHLAWIQVPPGLGGNAWYTLGGGRLDGLLRITRGRYLHLDADLALYDGGTGQGYRARFNRRMRSDELHYLDDPRLGILIRAARVDASPGTQDAADTSSGEPRPARPDAATPAD